MAACPISWSLRNLAVSFTLTSKTKHAALTTVVSLENHLYPNPEHNKAICQEACLTAQ